MGSPVVVFDNTRTRFRVHQRQPVPVQVEPVMVGACTGPVFHALACICSSHGHAGSIMVGPTGEAVEAVRIDAGIQQNHRPVQQLLDEFGARRCQVISSQQRRVAATGLVAMHAVTQPRDQRAITIQVRPAQLFQVLLVGLGCNGKQQQGPLFVGMPGDLDRHPRGCRRQGLHIVHQLVVAYVPATHFPAQHGLRRGDGRVRIGIGRQVFGSAARMDIARQ